MAAGAGTSGAAGILAGILDWAGMALVCTNGPASGVFTSLVTVGAGVAIVDAGGDVTVIGGRLAGSGFGWGAGI